MKPPRLLWLLCLPVLAACENNASSYMIDGREHALVLIREQPTFWSDVKQSVVVSRMPKCQRNYPIQAYPAGVVDLEVYEAGYRVWALHQGRQWYLVGTEKCQLQEWANPKDDPPGKLVGRFVWGDKGPTFVADQPKPQ